jgi:chaperone required for assembly of F1-ATPase
MKRFWDFAETIADPLGWQIRLDGRPVRIPGGTALAVPSRPLADAIAAEWQAAGGEKGGEFSLQAMHLTRLASTAQERVDPAREAIALELARYGESDLLCYRAEIPQRLAERQHAEWQPWLDWAERTHGARLVATAGIIHLPQDTKALAALAEAVAAHDTIGLAALGVLVPALGSLVLGLAVAGGALSGAEAHAVSVLDDIFQEELWGRDADAHAGRLRVAADVVVAETFLTLARA